MRNLDAPSKSVPEIYLRKRSVILRILSLIFVLSASQQAAAQDLVVLQPGLWEHQQSTFVNGGEIVAARLSNRECLSEEDAQKTVDAYFEELVASANEGGGQNCSFTSPVVSPGFASTNVTCSANGATTQAKLEYRHSPERVDFELVGTAQTGGTTVDLRVDGRTVYVGAC